jgi:hypothetical protein
MSLIKKIDVEAHFAARRRARQALARLATLPAVKLPSVAGTAGANADASGFREDFSLEHTLPKGPVGSSK